jgi:hypothetical protein
MYAVISGQNKLVRYSPRGHELPLHPVQPGRSFAEVPLFGSGTYPATAKVVEAARLWVLPGGGDVARSPRRRAQGGTVVLQRCTPRSPPGSHDGRRRQGRVGVRGKRVTRAASTAHDARSAPIDRQDGLLCREASPTSTVDDPKFFGGSLV